MQGEGTNESHLQRVPRLYFRDVTGQSDLGLLRRWHRRASFLRREVHTVCKLKRTAAGGTEQAEVAEEVRVLGVARGRRLGLVVLWVCVTLPPLLNTPQLIAECKIRRLLLVAAVDLEATRLEGRAPRDQLISQLPQTVAVVKASRFEGARAAPEQRFPDGSDVARKLLILSPRPREMRKRFGRVLAQPVKHFPAGAPGGPKAVKSATLEAASSSTRDSRVGWLSP